MYICILSPLPFFVTPWTVAHQAPRVYGIFQARILEWVVISSPKGSFQPRGQTRTCCVAGGFFTTEPSGKPCIYIHSFLKILSHIGHYRVLSRVPCAIWTSQVALVVKNPPANPGDVKDAGSVPGLGRSSGGGHGHSLQCSCLENPMDGGAWLYL